VIVDIRPVSLVPRGLLQATDLRRETVMLGRGARAIASVPPTLGLGPFWVSVPTTVPVLQDLVIQGFPSSKQEALTATAGNQTIVCVFFDIDCLRLAVGRGRPGLILLSAQPPLFSSPGFVR
jgi:hypothetical protein